MNWTEDMKIPRWAWYVVVALGAMGAAAYLLHWWQILSPHGNTAIQLELAKNQVDLARAGEELRSIVDNHRTDSEWEATETRHRLKRIERRLRLRRAMAPRSHGTPT